MRPPAPRKTILRYLFPAAMLALVGGLWLLDRARGEKAVEVTLYSLKEMLLIIPPIFIILGLLDVWVPRETMIRFMGPRSGIRGVAIAFVLGAAAAGPLYGAFPVAQVLLRKGSSFRNVIIFLGAWSTTKIPMLLFEAANMGLRFTITRLVVDVVGIAVMALLIDRLLGDKDRSEILAKAG